MGREHYERLVLKAAEVEDAVPRTVTLSGRLYEYRRRYHTPVIESHGITYRPPVLRPAWEDESRPDGYAPPPGDTVILTSGMVDRRAGWALGFRWCSGGMALLHWCVQV